LAAGDLGDVPRRQVPREQCAEVVVAGLEFFRATEVVELPDQVDGG